MRKDVLVRFVEDEVVPKEKEWMRLLHGEPQGEPVVSLRARATALGLPGGRSVFGSASTLKQACELAEAVGRSPLASVALRCGDVGLRCVEWLEKFGPEECQKKWIQELEAGQSCAAVDPALALTGAFKAPSVSMVDENGGSVLHGSIHNAFVDDPTFIPLNVPVILFCAVATSGGSKVACVKLDSEHVTLKPQSVMGYSYGLLDIALQSCKGVHWLDDAILTDGVGPIRSRLFTFMKSVGLAERCLDAQLDRVTKREAFGKALVEHGTVSHDIARARLEIDQCRLLLSKVAHLLDSGELRGACYFLDLAAISQPSGILSIIDRAIQSHGAGGFSDDFILAFSYAHIRLQSLLEGDSATLHSSVSLVESNQPRFLKAKL